MKQKKSNKYRSIWVSPDFANKIKSEAAQNGCSIFDYTKELAQSQDNVRDIFKRTDKAFKRGFKFEL